MKTCLMKVEKRNITITRKLARTLCLGIDNCYSRDNKEYNRITIKRVLSRLLDNKDSSIRKALLNFVSKEQLDDIQESDLFEEENDVFYSKLVTCNINPEEIFFLNEDSANAIIEIFDNKNCQNISLKKFEKQLIDSKNSVIENIIFNHLSAIDREEFYQFFR